MATPTNKNDCTNKSYVDQKIGESHISSHENRKNVFEYIIKIPAEFTTDFEINICASLLIYNFTPHLINKAAYKITILKKINESVFKGRWDFNLFKLTQDNYSDHYTACIEMYLQNKYDHQFNNFKLTFQTTNINIDHQTYKKINDQYQYFRCILNLSPDGSSRNIQRCLYITFEASYDNKSPSRLPIYLETNLWSQGCIKKS